MIVLSKKVLLPVAVLTVVVTAAYGFANVSASSDPSQSLAGRLATTFHLDQSKVQTVIDQDKSDHQAGSEIRYEQTLTKAVTDGKLTAAQKSAVLDEHNQLKSELDSAMQKSGSDRRTALQSIRQEAESWAKSHNVEARLLLGGRPLRGMGPGKMHRGAAFGSNSPAPSPSASVMPAQ